MDILLLWNCTYKTGNGIWIQRKGDDVISLEKTNQAADLYLKELSLEQRNVLF
jgi:hypothetical protein